MPIYDPIAEALGIESNPEIFSKLTTQYVSECKIPSPFKGLKHTDETRLLMSKSQTGKKYTEETLLKMRQAKLGKKLDPATKIKMSEVKKGKKNHFYGKKHSDKTKKILSEKCKNIVPWNKGKVGVQKHNDETKLLISDNLRKRKCSDYTRLKLSEARKKYWQRRKNGN
jgi:hypothetical protein